MFSRGGMALKCSCTELSKMGRTGKDLWNGTREQDSPSELNKITRMERQPEERQPEAYRKSTRSRTSRPPRPRARPAGMKTDVFPIESPAEQHFLSSCFKRDSRWRTE